jgi:anti-sigma regulatory factor (Ser/Thr protein kinase)
VNGPRTAVVDLPSEAGMASAARVAVRAFLEASSGAVFDERELDEIAVVVQEACTNVVRHAHGLDPAKRLRVEVRLLDDGVAIVVNDEGPEFRIDGELPLPGELREGGYGIHIMRTWMDEVSVSHDGRGNSLRLVRRARALRSAGGSLAAR